MTDAIVWPDVLIVSVFVISIVIALFRGFVREFISIASWVAAIWLGIVFAEPVANYLPSGLDNTQFSLGSTEVDIDNLRVGIAFILIAVGVLIGGAILNYIFGVIMKAQVLRAADRFMGAIFGAVRAAVIVVALIMIAYLTSLPTTRSWQESALLPVFDAMAQRVVENLPDKYARYFVDDQRKTSANNL